MARTETFESIVAAVKALGLKWHRGANGMLQCENNNCVAGALMVHRKKMGRYYATGGRYYATGADAGRGVNPNISIIADALDIDEPVARRIANANDGRPVIPGDTNFVYHELGVPLPAGIDDTAYTAVVPGA